VHPGFWRTPCVDHHNQFNAISQNAIDDEDFELLNKVFTKVSSNHRPSDRIVGNPVDGASILTQKFFSEAGLSALVPCGKFRKVKIDFISLLYSHRP
jgi:hypothetical protein